MVRNLPAMQETWIQSLGWEDALEKGMANHSTILAWRVPWTKEPGGSMGRKESDMTEGVTHTHTHTHTQYNSWHTGAGTEWTGKKSYWPEEGEEVGDHKGEESSATEGKLQSLTPDVDATGLVPWWIQFYLPLIAYSQQCQILDLPRRRFSFRTRDQPWSLKSFCVAVLLKYKKEQRKLLTQTSEERWRVPPLASASKRVIHFFNWSQ